MVPNFLKHVRLSKSDTLKFDEIMSGWGKIFHHMARIKTMPAAEQKTTLEKMLVYELEHEERLIILTRLLGRYKMTLCTELEQQMFQ